MSQDLPIRALSPAAMIVLLATTLTQAWTRRPYEDAEVVARSELIVVGRIDEGSIEFVPHRKDPDRGRSYEHHARLIVTEVLKGDLKAATIPIIIHYGLTPVVGGYVRRDGFMYDLRHGHDDDPKDIIEILDTGSSAGGGASLIKDARTDNLWFLRRRSGIYGREPGNGNLGIVDPEDLKPLAIKFYILAYLSADPEQAVRRAMAEHTEIRARAQRYLDHREVGRILKIDDPRARVEKLLPYFVKQRRWGLKSEAREGIVASGGVAGPYLLTLFRDPGLRDRREDLITMLGEVKSCECVGDLVALLEEHDRFWATQDLEEGWWNHDVGSALTHQRRSTYGEVHDAVIALGRIGDARAREAIEATRRRWRAINFENPQIVEACDSALKAIAEKG